MVRPCGPIGPCPSLPRPGSCDSRWDGGDTLTKNSDSHHQSNFPPIPKVSMMKQLNRRTFFLYPSFFPKKIIVKRKFPLSCFWCYLEAIKHQTCEKMLLQFFNCLNLFQCQCSSRPEYRPQPWSLSSPWMWIVNGERCCSHRLLCWIQIFSLFSRRGILCVPSINQG